MSDVFFKVLNIKKADYNLGIGSGTHAEMTGKTMIGFIQFRRKQIHSNHNSQRLQHRQQVKFRSCIKRVRQNIKRDESDISYTSKNQKTNRRI